MQNKIKSFLFLLGIISSFIFLFYSCANPVMPTGGQKDTTPPKIIKEKSTVNPSLNFNEEEIILTYDEWVQLKDAFNQVVVSPPLAERLEVKLKGKSVIIKFPSDTLLRENTTYIINFGKSISDLNEGNIPPNNKFIFSTGDDLDSLTCTGVVADASTGKPVEDALIILYESLADSVVRTERPYYFAQADKSGNFKLEYMKAGTYKAFALVDNNYNYLFDLPNETIGFLEEPIVINDTTELNLSFQMFQEDVVFNLIEEKTRDKGILKFIFNESPENVEVDWTAAFEEEPSIEINGDSLIIWYTETDSVKERTLIFSESESDFLDTFNFVVPDKEPKLYSPKLKTNAKKIELTPRDSFTLEFSTPIAAINIDSIIIEKDSTLYSGFISADFTKNPKVMEFEFEKEIGVLYKIILLPNTVEDIYGQFIKDTISKEVILLEEDKYGELNLSVQLPDSTLQFIMTIENAAGAEIAEELITGATFKKNYKYLFPGKYTLTIIEDVNKNGKRDSGNYDEKRQPERIFKTTLEELRPNWELESEVVVKW